MPDQELQTSQPESDDATPPLFLQVINQWGEALGRMTVDTQGTREERADQLLALMNAADPLARAAISHHFVSNTESLDGTRAAAIAEENFARAMHDQTVPQEARDIYARLYPEIYALPLSDTVNSASSDQV